jgi:hypothetical protein
VTVVDVVMQHECRRTVPSCASACRNDLPTLTTLGDMMCANLVIYMSMPSFWAPYKCTLFSLLSNLFFSFIFLALLLPRL